MANEQNLVPNDKRTPSERRENAKKAGRASGEARRARKTFKEDLIKALSDGDAQEKMINALIRQAQRGNIKAFEVVRDTVGEKPVEVYAEHDERQDDPLSSSLLKLADGLDDGEVE